MTLARIVMKLFLEIFGHVLISAWDVMGKKYLDLSGRCILPRQGVPNWQRRGIAGSCTASASSTRVLRWEFIFWQPQTNRCPSSLWGTVSFRGCSQQWQQANWGAPGWCHSGWDPTVAHFCCASLHVVMEVMVLNEARFLGIISA